MYVPLVVLMHTVKSPWSSYSATGEITSHYESTVSEVFIGVSCTNAGGDIVGGGSTFTDGNVVGGDRTPFSVDLTVSQPPNRCEGTATLSNISEAQ
jgi:hypothetical protein